jgi:hypothetical protein
MSQKPRGEGKADDTLREASENARGCATRCLSGAFREEKTDPIVRWRERQCIDRRNESIQTSRKPRSSVLKQLTDLYLPLLGFTMTARNTSVSWKIGGSEMFRQCETPRQATNNSWRVTTNRVLCQTMLQESCDCRSGQIWAFISHINLWIQPVTDNIHNCDSECIRWVWKSTNGRDDTQYSLYCGKSIGSWSLLHNPLLI